MGDLLQLNVKSREKNGGFYDDLREEYENYRANPQAIGNKLTGKVERWLLDDKKLIKQAGASDGLYPQDIGDAISNRVCEIAGHVWLEFIEGTGEDSIRGTANYENRKDINAHVAEYIPEFEFDNFLEAFEATEGGRVRWSEVTDENLLKLLRPLLEAPAHPRNPLPVNTRPRSGSLPGYVNVISPDQLRGGGESWFKDRMESDITPTWQIDDSIVITDSILQTQAATRYSFTPEHEPDSDNCVTWASRAINNLIEADWLDSVRAHCGTTACTTPPPKPCDDLHIRAEGRMKCIAGYASQADAERRKGFGAFHD